MKVPQSLSEGFVGKSLLGLNDSEGKEICSEVSGNVGVCVVV